LVALIGTFCHHLFNDRNELRRHIDYLENEAGEWSRRADLAVRREREDLARAALAEKQAIADRVTQLNGELGLLDQQLAKFNEDITLLQAKLLDAKKRQRSIVLRHKTATTQLAARKHIHGDRIDEMLFRFENAEKKIDRIESEGEVLGMGRRKTLADEIAGLEDDDRVEAALADLKAQVKGAPKSKAPSKESKDV